MSAPLGGVEHEQRHRMDRHFRWRGQDVSRLEAFSDAAFAFSLTYLIFSGASDIRTVDGIREVVKGFLPFAATFALLVMIWIEHYLYFRRYGIRDGITVALNCALLFVMLFYVFPLKFLFTLLFLQFLSRFDATATLGGLELASAGVDGSAMGELLLIYNLGFGAVYAIYAMLYHRAWRLRDSLGLDAVEQRMTRNSLEAATIMLGFALLSTLMLGGAYLLQSSVLAAASGLVYFGIGPAMGIHGWRRGRLVGQLVAARARPDA